MSATAPRLSVLTISKNEERDLPGFLENFLPWVDEIVILDDGSTDRTPELARAAGEAVRFVVSARGPGEGFAHQRNKSIEHATGDWLLHVDVDMRATPELVAEIRRALGDAGRDAWNYRRQHFFLNRPMSYAGVQHWYEPWLVRRGLGRFEGLVHEKLVIATAPERIGRLDEPIWHLGDDTFEERLEKNLLYSALDVEGWLAEGRRTSLPKVLVKSAVSALYTYFRRRGLLDGRLGAFWALYIFSSNLNRYLMLYSRQDAVPRERLEDELRERMRRAGLGDAESEG